MFFRKATDLFYSQQHVTAETLTKGEWPACSDRRGNNLPRPILISVATKENGFACNGRGGYEVRFRF